MALNPTPFPNIITTRDPSFGIEAIRDEDLRFLERNITLEQYKLKYIIKNILRIYN